MLHGAVRAEGGSQECHSHGGGAGLQVQPVDSGTTSTLAGERSLPVVAQYH